MRHVLRVLESYGAAIFPKRSSLAKRCGMTLGTLVRMLDELKRDGILKVERRGPTSNLYLLSLKPEMATSMATSMATFSAPHLLSEVKPEGFEGLAPSQRKRALTARNPAAYAKTILESEARIRKPAVRAETPRVQFSERAWSFDDWKAAGLPDDADAFLEWALSGAAVPEKVMAS